MKKPKRNRKRGPSRRRVREEALAPLGGARAALGLDEALVADGRGVGGLGGRLGALEGRLAPAAPAGRVAAG